MAFSSGTFSLVAGNPVVTNTTISSTVMNNTLNDIATGLTTCILKDGTQTATAKVPFAVGIDVTTEATTGSTTFACFNTTATTINAFGAATTLNIGAAGGAAAFPGGISIPTSKTLDFVGTGGILGTATNDSAAALNVGEYVESSVTAQTIASGATRNLTSISLTAGDWDVSAIVSTAAGGVNTYVHMGISQTSATFTGTAGKDELYFALDTTSQAGSGGIPKLRISLAATTTIYLVMLVATTITSQVNGYISARRAR